MTQRIADRWAALVERTGTEVSVTLLVSGTIVSGFLCATARYSAWSSQSVAITQVMGNGEQENTAPPPTDAEVLLIRQQWEDDHGDSFPTLDDFHATELCLRNAMVMGPPGSFTFAYLLIDASCVDAFTLGAARV